MTWCVRYFNRSLLQLVEHLDSARFPFLIVQCSVVMFDMEVDFDMGEYSDSRMEVGNGEPKFSKCRFHKVLKIINRVARSNSYNSSGKGIHNVKVEYNSFQFYILVIYVIFSYHSTRNCGLFICNT